jgi:hypothetical protein
MEHTPKAKTLLLLALDLTQRIMAPPHLVMNLMPKAMKLQLRDWHHMQKVVKPPLWELILMQREPLPINYQTPFFPLPLWQKS